MKPILELIRIIERLAITETEALNRLTDAGIISDNVVGLEDVANADCLRASEWLEQNPGAVAT